MASKRRCTGVDATSSRRIEVISTSFQRHVPAGGWMVRFAPSLWILYRDKKIHMSFGRVVSWLLDAHFIVGTA